MTPIDSLPDDVLLLIFKSHVHDGSRLELDRAWRSLVRVCQRWRSVVFGSPGHLDLRLVCTTRTPVRNALDIWPSLPLRIMYEGYSTGSVDNIIAGLERTDRVREVSLWNTRGSDPVKTRAELDRVGLR